MDLSSLMKKRCATCKFLRRICAQDCILAMYFLSNNPRRFDCCHIIFGASNICKRLQQLPVHLRAEAADWMAFEAATRVGDLIYGCIGIISQLEHQITQAQAEVLKIRGKIAHHNAQRQKQQQQPPRD